MSHIAKLFTNGRSQAVRLPVAFRFDTPEVFIRRDPETGDVILSNRPNNWNDFFALQASHPVPTDFLNAAERQEPSTKGDSEPSAERDPLDGLPH